METIFIGAAVLLGVLGLLIGLLAVPIDLAFNIDRTNQTQGEVKVRWLFGLLRYSVNIPDNEKPRKLKKKNRTKTQTKTKNPASPKSSLNVLALLKQPAFRQRLIKFLKDLLRASHYRDLFLRLRIGLDDPADTGQLWALMGPIAVMASSMRSASVHIEPEFMDPVFEVQSHGKFRFIPLEFIVLAIGFALSPPSLRAWRSLRHSNALL